VVLGVDRIAGEKLDFGSVAHAVLSKSNASVLLIADGYPAPDVGREHGGSSYRRDDDDDSASNRCEPGSSEPHRSILPACFPMQRSIP